MLRRSIATVALVLLVCSAAHAQSGDGQCASAATAFGDKLALARIAKSRGKVHFVRTREDALKECPGAAPACRDTAYLVAGDVVVTQASAIPGFVCSTYANAKGRETTGWLPADALEPIMAAPVTSKNYVGRWQRVEAEIKIMLGRNGVLQIDGEATYGALDPERVKQGAVNMGDLTGVGRFVGEVLLVAEPGVKTFETAPETTCAARLRRVGRYLLAEDNHACGGANVSFSGVYVKR